ncbi:MAG: M23 family metallopeptidase [Butyricicoccus sp.]
MKSKRKQAWLSPLDGVFLAGAVAFLASAIFRVCQPVDLQMLRERAAAWVVGDFSAQEIVQAFGDWEHSDELVATVFHAEDYKEPDTDSGTETGFERDALDGETVEFPDTVDRMTYLIDLTCKTPVEGIVTSGFGERTDPIDGGESYHYGIDIAADEGTPICAVAEGTVREVGENSYGKYLILDHGAGLQSLYAHCSEIFVQKGASVQSGEQIAAVGMTGRATGNHLHFELWRAGMILDPTGYLEV